MDNNDLITVMPKSVTFSFLKLLVRILMKFNRNELPAMVLFQISCNNLIPSKTLVVMATKLKIF